MNKEKEREKEKEIVLYYTNIISCFFSLTSYGYILKCKSKQLLLSLILYKYEKEENNNLRTLIIKIGFIKISVFSISFI
jgi:hypothetical protein